MKSGRDIRIITNNPLVVRCLSGHYEIEFVECTYRELLVKARDLVFLGYGLFTHPMAGSVKPNETPYKSLVLSKQPGTFSEAHAELMSSAVATFDKFTPRNRELTDKILGDFQMIDYTLLCSALDFDAVAGLSK